MDTQQTLDALEHLSKTHRAQFQERRVVVEWRCFFTTVTFFALTVAAIYKGDVDLVRASYWVFVVGCSVVALISIGFLGHVNMAGNKDKELAELAEDGIRDLISGKSPRRQEIGFNRYFVSWKTIIRRGSWGYIWQSLTILFIALIAMFLVKVKPLKQPTEANPKHTASSVLLAP